jgi:hypothetical protein
MSGRHEQSEGFVFRGEIHVLRYGAQDEFEHGASISQGVGLVCGFLLNEANEGHSGMARGREVCQRTPYNT